MRNNRLLKSFASVTVIATVLAMAVISIPVKAETEDEAVNATIEGISELLRDNEGNDAFAFRNVNRRRLRSASPSSSLPERYSLRDPNGDGDMSDSYVTSVKSQNPFGTCWGFAATASAETSLISSGLADRSIDLSEKHTAFFVYRPVLDENNSQYGEGMNFQGEPHSPDIFTGGFSFYATGLYASGAGPVNESDNTQFLYRGDPNNKNEYNYLSDSQWWIDDNLRFAQDYTLKESHIMPNPALCLKKGDATGFNSAINAMKSEIRAGRPMYIDYASPNSQPGQDLAQDYINTETWAHYTYKWDQSSDHAVVIVGWDDNYPKENFVHVYNGENTPAPSNDGAWLVKNSWGSGEEEFPNNCGGDWGLFHGQEGKYNESAGRWEYNKEDDVHTGYFWLSYEDHSIEQVESLVFDSVREGEQYTAQYDYMPVVTVKAGFGNFDIKTANVFTVGDHTQGKPAYINSVSCQTLTPGTNVKYELYKLQTTSETPVDGELIAVKENTYAYGGFHKEELDSPVRLEATDRFSVVVTQITPDNKHVFSVQSTQTNQDEYENNRGVYKNVCVGIVNPGESFFYMQNGAWADYATSRTSLGLYDSTQSYDNFPIKAFMTPAPESQEQSSDITPPTPVMGLVYNGGEHYLAKTGSVPSGAATQYSIDEGVSYSEDIPAAISAGNYSVYYRVVDGEGEILDAGSFTTVIARKVIGVQWGDDSSWVYDGTKHEPELTVYNVCQPDGENYDDVYILLADIDSTNAGTYTARVAGLGGTAKDNYSLPGAGLTHDYEITKRQITLTSDSVTSVYTGNPVTADTVRVTSGSFVESQNVTCATTGSRTAPGESPNTFTYEFNEGTQPGNYEITQRFGTISVGWWDNVNDHVITVTAKDATAVYNGETQTVTPGLVEGCTKKTFDGVEYTVSGLSSSGSGMRAGGHAIEVTGTEEVTYETDKDATGHLYIEKVPGTFTITARNIRNAVIELTNEPVCDGTEKTQEFTVTDGGRTLTKDVDYTVSGDKATTSGEHTLVISGMGNYEGTQSKDYMILMPEIPGVSVSQKGTLTYSGYGQIPEAETNAGISGVSFTFAESENGPFASGIPTCKDAGEHTIYYKAQKNGYTDKTGTFTVTIQKAVIGINWKNTSFTYDGNDHVPTATATNVLGNDRLTLVVSGAASSSGTHTAKVTKIKGTGASNYDLPDDVKKKFDIKGSSGSSSSSSSSSGSSSSSSSSSGSSSSGSSNTVTVTPVNNSTNKGSASTGSTSKSTGSTNKNTGSNGSTSKSTGSSDSSSNDKKDDEAGSKNRDDASSDKKSENTGGDSVKKKESAKDKRISEMIEGTKLSDNEAALISILGEEKFKELTDSGKAPAVRLEASALDKVPSDEKKLAEETVKEKAETIPGLKIGEYLDLKLEVNEGEGWNNVESTDPPVRIMIKAPSDIVKKALKMYVLRIHQKKTDLLEDQDDDPETVSVDTGDFSTYVLCYQEKEEDKAKEAPDNVITASADKSTVDEPTVVADSTPTVNAATTVEDKSTSDNDMWRLWVFGVILVLVIAGVTVVCIKATKQ